MKKDTILIDIDGILADNTHRLPHIYKNPKDYDLFFSLMGDDKVYDDMRWLIDLLITAYYEKNGFQLIIYSGRPEEYKQLTTQWIKLHFPRLWEARPYLFLRESGDHRPADIVKNEMIKSFKRDYNVRMVIEDDPEVIRMLQREGISVLDPHTYNRPERTNGPPQPDSESLTQI